MTTHYPRTEAEFDGEPDVSGSIFDKSSITRSEET